MISVLKSPVTALILTIIIEGLLAYLFTKNKTFVILSICCNLFTNPLLNVILYYLGGGYMNVIISELCVVTAETLIYRVGTGEKFSKCLFYSFIFNLVSYILGLFFYLLLDVIL